MAKQALAGWFGLGATVGSVAVACLAVLLFTAPSVSAGGPQDPYGDPGYNGNPFPFPLPDPNDPYDDPWF